MNMMILAAGEGTRLSPYTLQTPKPAIPFLTVPLASYSLALLENIKIDTLVANTFHLPDQIEKLFKELNYPYRQLIFSSEKEQILGSGGGIHNAEASLIHGDHFIVMNGDEVILPSAPGLIQEMQEYHRWHKGIATLLVMDHPEVGKKFGGAWTEKAGNSSKVVCFSKTAPTATMKGHHFLGVMILSKRIFSYFKDQIVEENILYETLAKAMSLGEEVYVHHTNPVWFETGNPADFLTATEFCANSLQEFSNKTEKPYWLEYLTQTIRLNSVGKCMIEKDRPGLEEKVLKLAQQIKSN